jgi:predicted dehydrogenase
MTERIKYAAVGCGGMGRRHLRGSAALKAASFYNLELAAACDVRREQAELYADEAAELLGVRPRVFTDVAKMVGEMPELQAADVTVESGYHHTVSVTCMEHGLNVLCEKPEAVSIYGCNLMIEAAQRTGKVLSIAENFRRDPIQRLAKALIDDGALGDVRLMLQHSIGGRDRISMTVWRHMKHTASLPVDAGVHEADLMRFYLGDFRFVFGASRLHEKVRYRGDVSGPGAGGPGGFYGQYRLSMPEQIEPTGDDAVYAFIQFENGAIGQWIDDHAGHGLPRGERHVYGSKASLQVHGNRNGRPNKLYLDDGTAIDDQRILDYAPSYRLSPQAAEMFGGERLWTYEFPFTDVDSKLIALELFELGECIRTGAHPEMTAEEGRADVALTYAPFESGRLGRPVSMDDMVSMRAYEYQRGIDEELGLTR